MIQQMIKTGTIGTRTFIGKTAVSPTHRYKVSKMIETKDLIRLAAIFAAAVVILAAALVIFGREFTFVDVVIIAIFIAIAVIIAIRVAGFVMAVRGL